MENVLVVLLIAVSFAVGYAMALAHSRRNNNGVSYTLAEVEAVIDNLKQHNVSEETPVRFK